jgi:hypothetical protein
MNAKSVNQVGEIITDIRTAVAAIRRIETNGPGLNASELLKLAQMRVELQQLASRITVQANGGTRPHTHVRS